jgi:transcriptional regulator with XRE-family HTH domain
MNKKFHMDFGARVRLAREQAGLTREQFAEMIGKSPTFIADVERGSVGVSVPTLIRICEVLNISSDRLLWDKLSKTNLDERLQFLDDDYIAIIDKAIQNQIALIRLAERKNSEQSQNNENTEAEQTQD